MNVRTASDVDVDLSLTADESESENCWCCGPELEIEATGYIEYSNTCPCNYPVPAPLCEAHYQLARDYLQMYGPHLWECLVCGHLADVVGVYRKN
jgi:hypothetical protein